MRIALVFIFSILFNNICFSQENKIKKFKSILNDFKVPINEVSFSGYYINYSIQEKMEYEQPYNDSIECVEPIFFFQNGLLAFCTGIISGKGDELNTLITNHQKNLYRNHFFAWGTYRVLGSELEAVIFIPDYYGRKILTNYTGTILNDSNIIDWHDVFPNSNIIVKTESSELKFVRFDQKSLIDSSKAWVNKFRYKR